MGKAFRKFYGALNVISNITFKVSWEKRNRRIKKNLRKRIGTFRIFQKIWEFFHRMFLSAGILDVEEKVLKKKINPQRPRKINTNFTS